MGEDNNIEMKDRFLGRDGHLTERAVNRWLAGELAGDDAAFVGQHLVECPVCEGRVEAVKAHDQSFSIAPSAAVRAAAGENVVSLEERRSKRGPMLAGLVLAAGIAAAVAIMVSNQRPQPARVEPGAGEDDIRFKGGGLTLEVFANDGDKTRPLHDGDVVHPGERLGFQVSSRDGGWLLVLGLDDAGQVYPVHPSDGTAIPIDAGANKRDLESAVRLDDVGSKERLVAARCPAAFSLTEIADVVKGSTSLRAKPGEDRFSRCVYDEITVKKVPR